MTQRKSISGLLGIALGGLLAGLPATAAFAEEPLTAAEAQAKADHYRDRVEYFESLGGVGYKAGLVRSAETEVARYDAKAAELSGQPAAAPAGSQKNTPCPPYESGTKPSIQETDCETPSP